MHLFADSGIKFEIQTFYLGWYIGKLDFSQLLLIHTLGASTRMCMGNVSNQRVSWTTLTHWDLRYIDKHLPLHSNGTEAKELNMHHYSV